MKNDVIVACSTAAGAAGVAVIRLSGDNPLAVAKKMFYPTGKTPVEAFEPYRMYTGEIDGGTFRDFGMMVYFRAPKSFTGEDVVEFHSHGGVAIVRGILARAVENGARLATRGEYTRRAFLNGKLSLSAAEGLSEMIYSESEAEIRAGYSLLRETLKNHVQKVQSSLLAVLSEIDADLDFPEEDLESASREKIKSALLSAQEDLSRLLSTYQVGHTSVAGVKVAILGKPNVGKSSLLNALLHYEKAIVSDRAGTTRDVVEGRFDVNGVAFYLYDTAGIRETADDLEAVGVSRAERALKEADVALFVLDGGQIGAEDDEVFRLIQDRPHLTVVNKCDEELTDASRFSPDLTVSAKTGKGVEEIKTALYEKASLTGLSNDGEFLTEERHYDAVKRASGALTSALDGVDGVPLDLLAVDVKEAWQTLGEITGETASEKIVDEIFSKFCVGK